MSVDYVAFFLGLVAIFLIFTRGIQSNQGLPGIQGIQGPSGAQGLQGQNGIQGPSGANGMPGIGFSILGSFATAQDFIDANVPSGILGEAYLIEFDGSLYTWTSSNEWIDVGDIRGPQGPQGSQGIVGPQGIQGVQGVQGLQGLVGATGATGLVGPTGASGAVGQTFRIVGTYASDATFLSAVGQPGGPPVPGNAADCYLTTLEGSLWSWSLSSAEYIDIGDIRGPEGPSGARGSNGPTGPSGPSGPQGVQGLQGVPGPQGPTGVSGPVGATGPYGGGFFGQFQYYNNTTLTSLINNSSTVITVASTAGFSSSGYLLIQNEVIKYTGLNGIGTQFTGITRNQADTSKTNHAIGVQVTSCQVSQFNGLGVPEVSEIQMNVSDFVGTGCTLSDLRTVTVANAGTYNITYSIQFTNGSTNLIDDAYVWYRINGIDVAASTSVVSVPVLHSGHSGASILTVAYCATLTASSTIKLMWHTNSGSGVISTYPLSPSAPVRPISPAIILQVFQIA